MPRKRRDTRTVALTAWLAITPRSVAPPRALKLDDTARRLGPELKDAVITPISKKPIARPTRIADARGLASGAVRTKRHDACEFGRFLGNK